jgi:hypothetical protein
MGQFGTGFDRRLCLHFVLFEFPLLLVCGGLPRVYRTSGFLIVCCLVHWAISLMMVGILVFCC